MKFVRFGLALFCLSLPAIACGKVQAVVGQIKETRCSNPGTSELELELKLYDYEGASAKSIRLVPTQCVDDTGKDLLDRLKDQAYLQRCSDSQKNKIFKIKLLAPARKARSIAQLKATVELLKPETDAASTVRIPHFKEKVGQTLSLPALSAAGIDLSLLTPTQYRTKNRGESQAQNAKGIAGKNPFDMIFSSETHSTLGSDAIGLNDVICRFNDPNQKLGSIEFQDGSGNKIRDEGRSSSVDLRWESSKKTETHTEVFKFTKDFPDSAQMVIYVSTAKSSEKEEVVLSDIELP